MNLDIKKIYLLFSLIIIIDKYSIIIMNNKNIDRIYCRSYVEIIKYMINNGYKKAIITNHINLKNTTYIDTIYDFPIFIGIYKYKNTIKVIL